MSYVTTRERRIGFDKGMRQGLMQGIVLALELKFGSEGLAIFPEIRQIKDWDILETILAAVKRANTLNELYRLCDYQAYRQGQRLGWEKVIELVLEQKFGSEGVDILPDIPQIQNEKQLEATKRKLLAVNNLSELRQMYQSMISDSLYEFDS